MAAIQHDHKCQMLAELTMSCSGGSICFNVKLEIICEVEVDVEYYVELTSVELDALLQ